MTRPTREQHAAIMRRVMGKTNPTCTEEYLIESIKEVQKAIVANQLYAAGRSTSPTRPVQVQVQLQNRG